MMVLHWIILIICPLAAVFQFLALWTIPVWAVPLYAFFFVLNYYNSMTAIENILKIDFLKPRSSKLKLVCWRHDVEIESEEP